MKFFLLPIVFCLLFCSCDQKSKVEKAIEETPVDEIKVERFDKQFFETSPKDLSNLKKKYPYFFSPQINDTVWINKMTAPIWREVYAEVEKKYPSTEGIQNECGNFGSAYEILFSKDQNS